MRERGSAVYQDGDLAYLQGLVVGAEAEFNLREQLEEQVADTRVATSDIVGLTGQNTSSVKVLSMLSINAGIEAARSGEAGKGIAVIANERSKRLQIETWSGRIKSQIGSTASAAIIRASGLKHDQPIPCHASRSRDIGEKRCLRLKGGRFSGRHSVSAALTLGALWVTDD